MIMQRSSLISKFLYRQCFSTCALIITFFAGSETAYSQSETNFKEEEVAYINGEIHTMDNNNSIVSEVLVRNGRIVAVGNNVTPTDKNIHVIDLHGKTVIPGIIDAHNHIVLVGNRPGRHAFLEHIFTIPEAIALLQKQALETPKGEFITIVGPISAMQFDERRLPDLSELDTIDRPVYIQSAQGGTKTNSLGKVWLETKGVTVGADGSITRPSIGLALQALRREFLTTESRKRSAFDALFYYSTLGITTHRDSGALHADEPATGMATENTYTMHKPFMALNRDNNMPARLRFDFFHNDPPDADPPLPTLTARLKNSFPFFGDSWLRSGGIGEFTGGGVDGLRAIARAGWRAEDHSLNQDNATTLILNREIVNQETPITDLHWIISHIPEFSPELANRADALGMGLLVGWGPLRSGGTDLGPPYRMLYEHPIPLGYHSDGGDINVINPWLNFYTMVSGQNLAGEPILSESQTLSRWQALWLATAGNKWFIQEDDLGSIEVGHHADLVVLNKDYFNIPAEDIKHIQSILTVIGGKIIYSDGSLQIEP